MTNSKSTKGALLVSSISLLLCFAMLLGTTFAWFTDSATSANNIIKSGNLDVEFKYWDEDANDWATVQGASDILTNKLWEPGVTEVAYLKVTNAGSLALKYQLGVNIVSETPGINVAGDNFKLSDYIMFGVEEVSAENAYAKREDAVAALTNAKKISAGYSNEKTMEANSASHYFALVVYMPETVDNKANHNGTNVPEIDLGINVLATQLASENDSFDNQYDKDAVVADVYVATEADLLDALETAGEGEVIGLTSNIQMPTAAGTNGYGATGLSITNGQTFDGGNNTFGVQAYGTWDSAINITGGTIKNITINKGFRGIFINHNSTYKAPVILENVIVNGPTYTISCDQGTNSGLKAFNSKFYGWTSYAATIGNVEFTNCTFGAGAGYNYSRPYAPTTYVNCKFEKGHVIDARAAVTFENCTIDGVELTDANIAELVGNNANVTVK